MEQRQQQDALLRDRPTSEEAASKVVAARDAVRDALATELGLTAWSDLDDFDRAGCGDPFGQSSGKTVYPPGLLLTGGIPDAAWPRAVEVVRETATAFGFDQLDIVVDEPGEHEVVMIGEFGAVLRLGTLQNATLSLQTGCHLPESDL